MYISPPSHQDTTNCDVCNEDKVVSSAQKHGQDWQNKHWKDWRLILETKPWRRLPNRTNNIQIQGERQRKDWDEDYIRIDKIFITGGGFFYGDRREYSRGKKELPTV